MLVSQQEFTTKSAYELGRDHDFVAKLIGLSIICPISGNLVEIPFNKIRVEDREIFILCCCETIHEVGGF